MSMLILKCPHCGEGGRIHEAYSGQSVSCPKCHKEFEVGGTGGTHVSSVVPSSREEPRIETRMPIKFNCPDCGAGLTVPEGYRGKQVACKSCGSVITDPNDELAFDLALQAGRPMKQHVGYPDGDHGATTSLVLGIIGLFVWILPMFGFPITIIGLVKGRRSLAWANTSLARIAVTLCIIGLVLTSINAAVGGYLGAANQHPAFKVVSPNPGY